ncbi:TetR/AcrR family transcriptional regulator [Marinomonas sp. M1K-6]|uniref:TetR/AcrR family transcriptional regulator n=1 Tax=Marinomonas profundi TaxID=2726122 RepID=A0A847R3T5_9GAMM|nr:TetR/AcrR family transcriptional regulator [Marinomonas profundi]NLQ18615.1 TetR/AcrR family transcriptional regulator [Marinomonas profundi]UDV02891.1 TetR/AcrR family transcriptional regulator [Marinomonas profundi]
MSLRQQQKANTRSKIKAIAKQAFLTQGIEATSTRYLSDQAGIAVGTLFVHFPDKLSLVKDIFFDEMDLALRAAVIAQKASASPIDYLLQMAQVLFDFYDQYAEFTRQVLFDSLAKGGFHTNQMMVISEGIVKRFKQIGVDEKTANIFAENMIANYWFVLLSAVPKGVLGQDAIEHLQRMNLPFEMSYRNALKKTS